MTIATAAVAEQAATPTLTDARLLAALATRDAARQAAWTEFHRAVDGRAALLKSSLDDSLSKVAGAGRAQDTVYLQQVQKELDALLAVLQKGPSGGGGEPDMQFGHLKPIRHRPPSLLRTIAVILEDYERNICKDEEQYYRQVAAADRQLIKRLAELLPALLSEGQKDDAVAAEKLKRQLEQDQPALVERAEGWIIVFRSDQPGDWDRDLDEGPDRFAMATNKLRTRPRYVRLRRMDTGQTVAMEMQHEALNTQHEQGMYIWNGSARRIRTHTRAVRTDSRVLGIGDKRRRIGYRKGHVVVLHAGTDRGEGYSGWGFGRIALHHSNQHYLWNGAAIKPVVFEIAVKTSAFKSGDRGWLLR